MRIAREAQPLFSGSASRMLSSRSCFGVTSDGAPIIKSSALIAEGGNMITVSARPTPNLS